MLNKEIKNKKTVCSLDTTTVFYYSTNLSKLTSRATDIL